MITKFEKLMKKGTAKVFKFIKIIIERRFL